MTCLASGYTAGKLGFQAQYPPVLPCKPTLLYLSDQMSIFTRLELPETTVSYTH